MKGRVRPAPSERLQHLFNFNTFTIIIIIVSFKLKHYIVK